MIVARALLLTGLSLTGACGTLDYYAQSVTGQIHVLQAQRNVREIISDPDTDPLLRLQLTTIESILDYARSNLDLPDNESYQSYADLQREYIVWNVFAAPEFSLQPKEWCYLIIGCTSYRGYFSKQQAVDYTSQLAQSGWEVSVNGVIAYSTLGWFRDPLLNTMLARETWETARLLFHELAHQQLYIRNDTDFNEAFADAVAQIGLRGWLQWQSAAVREAAYTAMERESQFNNLLLETRDRFAVLYQAGLPEQDMRFEKLLLMNRLQMEYQELKAQWDGDTRFDQWIATSVNNASLSALSTYRTLVPDFLAAYEFHGAGLPGFYQWVEMLSECSKNDRLQNLRELTPVPDCSNKSR